jgi:hypothetical protein
MGAFVGTDTRLRTGVEEEKYTNCGQLLTCLIMPTGSFKKNLSRNDRKSGVLGERLVLHKGFDKAGTVLLLPFIDSFSQAMTAHSSR